MIEQSIRGAEARVLSDNEQDGPARTEFNFLDQKMEMTKKQWPVKVNCFKIRPSWTTTKGKPPVLMTIKEKAAKIAILDNQLKYPKVLLREAIL